jgi:hypothetical protein
MKRYAKEHEVMLTAQFVRSEMAACCAAAQHREERLAGIGGYYFLSTRYGDGFVLDTHHHSALPLCIDGEAIEYEYETVEEIDPIRFTIEFTGTYRFCRDGLLYADVDGWDDTRTLSPDMRRTLKKEGIWSTAKRVR